MTSPIAVSSYTLWYSTVDVLHQDVAEVKQKDIKRCFRTDYVVVLIIYQVVSPERFIE